jgi:hypothetical protein
VLRRGATQGERVSHPTVIEGRFLERSDRLRTWGIGLAVVAGLLWAYAMFELFTPWHTTYGHYSCSAPAFGDRGTLYSESDADNSPPFGHHDAALACAQDRDWPQPMAALAVALPVGAVGASLVTAGMVSGRLRRLESDLGRTRK